MKKYFIFAVAAVVATAACTKVETIDNTPDQAISFQVANYSVQTKAYDDGGLLKEGFDNFKTYAWYTPATGTANQEFMAPATIGYVAASGSADAYWHATDRTYFWPKTGYVNFFSFAGNHLPSSVSLDSEAKAQASYSNVTVATTDNILIADGAYGFFSNPTATYGKDGVASGVPTLFRHMLSRVKFDINLDATNVSDNKNNWAVEVNSAVVSYRNQGSLAVSFPATPSISFDTDGHPTTAGSTAKYNAWTWTPASVANATLTKVASVTFDADGGEVSQPVSLIADSVVMPQDLATTGVTIALNYTITHTYNGTNAVVETVPVAAKALTAFASPISAWVPNTIYTYHITIKPNGEVLFDPAVETWAVEATEPVYTIE